MIRAILVPLDGTTFGEHALPLAAALARRCGATLHLVHVHRPELPVSAEGFAVLDVGDLHSRQDEQVYLADAARRVAEKAPINLKTLLMDGDGDVVEGLKGYAQSQSIDLVVMSTHARGTFGRFWLGSVTDDLAHELDRPLLLVHPGEGRPDLSREADFKSIVVPLDGSELAEQALEPAVEMAGLFGAELRLVRVNAPGLRPAYLPEGVASSALVAEAAEIERREEAEAQSYLDAVAARLTARGAQVKADVLIEDEPAAGILHEADVAHADLIAMETHGRRGLARFFMGSVADAVVRGGEAPVLLMHPATGRVAAAV